MKRKVKFLPDNISITVEHGENLLNAAANAGVFIQAFCGGEGVCGKCRIKLEKGEDSSTQTDSLNLEDHTEGYRLACQTKVVSDLVVRIPEEMSARGKALKRKPKTTRNENPKLQGPLAPVPLRS